MAERTDPIYGDSEEPRFAAERIANGLFEGAEEQATEEGVSIRRMFVLVELDDGPGDEPRLCSAGHGYEDSRDMLGSLLIHFMESARQIGLPVKVLGIDDIGRG